MKIAWLSFTVACLRFLVWTLKSTEDILLLPCSFVCGPLIPLPNIEVTTQASVIFARAHTKVKFFFFPKFYDVSKAKISNNNRSFSRVSFGEFF